MPHLLLLLVISRSISSDACLHLNLSKINTQSNYRSFRHPKIGQKGFSNQEEDFLSRVLPVLSYFDSFLCQETTKISLSSSPTKTRFVPVPFSNSILFYSVRQVEKRPKVTSHGEKKRQNPKSSYGLFWRSYKKGRHELLVGEFPQDSERNPHMMDSCHQLPLLHFQTRDLLALSSWRSPLRFSIQQIPSHPTWKRVQLFQSQIFFSHHWILCYVNYWIYSFPSCPSLLFSFFSASENTPIHYHFFFPSSPIM